MRPVRILLIAVALLAGAVTGWMLLGGGGSSGFGGYAQPGPGPETTAAPAPTQPQAAPSDPEPARDGDAPSGDSSGTDRRYPRPRIFGFGSEPVFGEAGGAWQLPAGPGEAILITDADHATKVEFLLTPAGTGSAGHATTIGVDTDGPAYTARWSYEDAPVLAHLTVRATGPGGTSEQIVDVYHPEQEP